MEAIAEEVENLKIYTVTLISNFLFGTVSVFCVDAAIRIAAKDPRSTSIHNFFAWIITFILFIAFIVLNYFCFKYCKKQNTGNIFTCIINTLMIFLGIASPYFICLAVF